MSEVSDGQQIYNDLVPASDALTSGYKNLRDEWVFRVVTGCSY